MAFTPLFSVSQTVGSPSIVTITDDSTGSDGAITQRRVYLQDAQGNYIVPQGTTTDYIAWALADTSINIDALSKDYALLITVQWLNVSNTVLYTKEGKNGLTLYNETFDYQVTQSLSGNPVLINDNNIFPNKEDLRESIDSGNQAISFGGDLYGAQQCYDRATGLRLSAQYLFNINS